MNSTHEIEYDYEVGEETYAVEATVELSWNGAEPSVGIMSAWAEVDDANFTINGVDIMWSPTDRDWVWGEHFPELDKAAFIKDFDRRCETVTEEAEAPEYEPDEPDYD